MCISKRGQRRAFAKKCDACFILEAASEGNYSSDEKAGDTFRSHEVNRGAADRVGAPEVKNGKGDACY